MRPAALAALFASMLCGADVKLAGQITEDATYQPIPGATVQVFGPAGERAAEQKTSTDRDGRFSLDLPAGRYDAVAYASGYDAARRENIGLNEGEPLRQLNLALTGYASIEGRILDRASKTPSRNAAVRAVKITYLRGKRQKWTAREIFITGPSGEFRIEKLPAGEYLLEIQPEERTQTREDGRTTGYGRETWPESSPLLLRGTDNLALGNILVERTVLGVVTITLDGACVKDVVYNVSVFETDQASRVQRGSLKASCHEPKKLTLSPGEYQAVATPPSRGIGAIGAESGTPVGVAAISHGQSDQDVNVTFRAPLLFSGVFTMEGRDAIPRWPQAFPVYLVPFGHGTERRISSIGPDYNLPTWADKEGKFTLRLHAGYGDVVQLQLPTLPPTHYIKELLYNGAPVDPFFHVGSDAPMQPLQIVLTGGSASFNGIARDDDKPVPGARILLARWPVILGASYPFDLVETTADNNGAFAFPSLRPGTYRMVSVTPERRQTYEEPGRLLNALSVAPDTKLGHAERLTRDLKVTEP
jgi:hypothetical protein